MGFESDSYLRHAENFSRDLNDADRNKIALTWLDQTTADYWRHARQYECADCISDHSSTWVTIGDGRWGLDSIRLRNKGFTNVMPTDISEPLLKAAHDQALISNYSVENAEKLSFEDNSFDYAFCKEAFHHFPRPYAALYEMLRVARKAVFLVEPNDPTPPATIQSIVKLGAKRLLRRPTTIPPAWEEIGNYVYTVSEREIEKVALGLNLPQIVIKGLNDCYIEGCEFETADVSRSEIFRKILQSIREADRSCSRGFRSYDMLMIGVFIEPLPADQRASFLGNGWRVIDLPRNPYIE